MVARMDYDPLGRESDSRRADGDLWESSLSSGMPSEALPFLPTT